MMVNLFSIFDPSTGMILSLNWMSVIMLGSFLPVSYWVIPSTDNFIWVKLMMFINSEIKLIFLKKLNYFNLLMFYSLFINIMLNNFFGLFPYIYSSSSHLSFSLSLSLLFWVSFMFYGWYNDYIHMFCHLTPQGTPYILMSFMVLIESVSNLIRPITLSVRLTANIIAGHLLMTLISNTSDTLIFMMIFIMIILQSLLMILEISVSFIQSYVFTILSSLYSSEVN